MRIAALALVLSLALPPGVASAQEGARALPPILMVDPRAVLEQSQTGRALLERHQQAREALQEEANAISRSFETEEQALAARRPLLTRDAFAELATDFDRRVRAARADQDRKAQELVARIEAEERAFNERLNPIYAEILSEVRGAAVIDLRNVILADSRLDISEEVIRRLDQPLVDPDRPAE